MKILLFVIIDKSFLFCEVLKGEFLNFGLNY
jgi:hypothetical protein